MTQNHVRVFQKPQAGAGGIASDSHRSARARVQLKLHALGYDGARRGADGGPGFCWDALVMLCQCAVAYVCALEGREVPVELADRSLHLDDGMAPAVRTYQSSGVPHPDQRIANGRARLKIAAIAYSESRHGADGGTGFSRDGLAMLCQAAISYVAALENQSKTHVQDPTLKLDDGM